MCGVAGWVSFDEDLTRHRPVIEAMTHSMTCRGPDDHGFWLSPHAVLGHRRLSIIDLPGGTQPMSVQTSNGTIALSYSGETYNFKQLRDELRALGHEFRTLSDTEVVLRGYLQWGAMVAQRMVGMCAIAIWDGRNERLTLIRDRVGTKPMQYCRTAGGIVFGSESKAILAHPAVEPVVDAAAMRQIFGALTVSQDAGWAGIQVLEPGTIVEFDRNGLRRNTYWRLAAHPHTDDLDTTVATVRSMLEENVRQETVADVPLGFLVSGGLDSSVLSALGNQHLAAKGQRITTFTVDYPGQTERFRPNPMASSPDGPFARDMAAHLGSDHHEIVLDHRALADPGLRASVVAACDLPLGLGDLNSSLYLLFKAVREHVTVVLSGEGADEVLGGHIWHHLPVAVHSGEFPWHTVWKGRRDANYVLTEQVRSVLDLDTYYADVYRDSVARVPYLDGDSTEQRDARRTLYLGLNHFMRSLEDRIDRMAMAVGLETRVPFCDYRMVEYLYNVPWQMHRFDGHEKSLLRAAVTDLLPQSVLNRRKSPYPMTQDESYVGALQEQVRVLLKQPHDTLFDIFDRAKIVEATELPVDVVSSGSRRAALERILDFAVWLDLRKPVLRLT